MIAARLQSVGVWENAGFWQEFGADLAQILGSNLVDGFGLLFVPDASLGLVGFQVGAGEIQDALEGSDTLSATGRVVDDSVDDRFAGTSLGRIDWVFFWEG